jgi:hypothetical protein
MNENLSQEGNVRLPKQVTARGEMARKILADQSAEPNPPAAPEAAAKPTSQFTAEELLQPPKPEKANDPVYWRGRANMIEGFRRQDNERTRQKIADLESTVASLNAKLAEATKSPPIPTPAATDPAREQAAQLRTALRELFSEDEVELLGEERALLIARTYIKQGATQETALSQLRSEIESLKSQQQTSQTKQTEDAEEVFRNKERTFFEQLTELFPTWQAVNTDQRWIDWLKLEDPSSGFTRQEIVNKHRRDLNAGKLVKVLEQFVGSLGASRVPPEPLETPRALPGTGSDAGEFRESTEGLRILNDAEMKEGFIRCSVVGKRRFSAEEEHAFRANVAHTMKQKGKA